MTVASGFSATSSAAAAESSRRNERGMRTSSEALVVDLQLRSTTRRRYWPQRSSLTKKILLSTATTWLRLDRYASIGSPMLNAPATPSSSP